MTYIALAIMIATQAVVGAASLSVPVLTPQISNALSLSPEVIGYYTSLIFIGAVAAAQVSPAFIRKYGPVRVSQATAIIAGLGLVLAALGFLPGLALSALVIGFAYAPSNPASSSLLSVVIPPQQRGFMFSLKQTAIPIGGMLAGILLPLIIGLGWVNSLLVMAVICVVTALVVQPWQKELDAKVNTGSAKKQQSPFAMIAQDQALQRLAIIAGCMASIQFTMGAIFVAFLTESSVASLATAGFLFSVAMAVSIALRIILGALADRLSGTIVLFGIAVLMLLSALICALVAFGFIDFGFWFIASVATLLGAITFSWNGVYLAEVAASVPTSSVSTATAATMTFVFLGGVIGPSLFSSIVFLTGDYAAGFVLLTLLSMVAGYTVLKGQKSVVFQKN